MLVLILRSGYGGITCSQRSCQVPHHGCSGVQQAVWPTILHSNISTPAVRVTGSREHPASCRFRPDSSSGPRCMAGRGGLHQYGSPGLPVLFILRLARALPGIFRTRDWRRGPLWHASWPSLSPEGSALEQGGCQLSAGGVWWAGPPQGEQKDQTVSPWGHHLHHHGLADPTAQHVNLVPHWWISVLHTWDFYFSFFCCFWKSNQKFCKHLFKKKTVSWILTELF